MLADGSFTYDPPAFFAGDDWVSFTVSNGDDEATAILIVHVTNSAPTVTSNPAYDASENQTLTVTVPGFFIHDLLYYAADADDDDLAIVAVNDDPDNLSEATATAHGTVTVEENDSFVYVPDTNFTGDDTFEVTISDGISTVTMTVTIHVT